MSICVIGMDDHHPDKLEKALKEQNINIVVFMHDEKRLVQKIIDSSPVAIILSGSKSRINEKTHSTIPKRILDLNIPILGICYGFQWLVKYTGGEICTFKDGLRHRYGKRLYLFDEKRVYMFDHHDFVCKMTKDWDVVLSGDFVYMAVNKEKKLMGIQFHPEFKNASSKTFFASNFLQIIS